MTTRITHCAVTPSHPIAHIASGMMGRTLSRHPPPSVTGPGAAAPGKSRKYNQVCHCHCHGHHHCRCRCHGHRRLYRRCLQRAMSRPTHYLRHFSAPCRVPHTICDTSAHRVASHTLFATLRLGSIAFVSRILVVIGVFRSKQKNIKKQTAGTQPASVRPIIRPSKT